MRKAHQEHPVALADRPTGGSGVIPSITYIIGHRGRARLPHLLMTLRSIAAQRDCEVECVVVEQDGESILAGIVPDWVRVVHTPPPVVGMPYCRSWTLNVGAKHARGGILILHDNDMLVPLGYSLWIQQRVLLGYEVVNAKRFIFYLSESDTKKFFAGALELFDCIPEVIVQNLEAGGSVAITRNAFFEIGGMDESFVGWGGEDIEFWERAQTRKLWNWGGLPLVHLWHDAQPGKRSSESEALRLYFALNRVPVGERVARLRKREFGAISGPTAC